MENGWFRDWPWLLLKSTLEALNVFSNKNKRRSRHNACRMAGNHSSNSRATSGKERRVLCSVLTLAISLAIGAFTSGQANAQAQAPDLFAAVPNNRLNNASDAQNQQLDQLRRRPSTLSLDLVRANTNTLKGRRVRIAIPGDGILTLSKTSGVV